MSLIRCPECAREISDAARFCPGCGHPMNQGADLTGVSSARLSRVALANGFYEYRSPREIFGWPLVHIVYGPAWLTGFRPARGIVAIGNVAVGVFALGGVAIGLFALGGLSLGLICLGGIALALGLGLGGIATGYVALGGVAIGVFALGGFGIGTHTLQNDPELLWYFGSRSIDR